MKKPSYRQLERETKTLKSALDATINDIVNEMTKIAATNKMIEEVMGQHQNGELTKL